MAEYRKEIGTGDLVRHVGTFAECGHITKEVNIIRWSGNTAVVDVRAWSTENGHARKGITVKVEEVPALIELLTACLDDDPPNRS